MTDGREKLEKKNTHANKSAIVESQNVEDHHAKKEEDFHIMQQRKHREVQRKAQLKHAKRVGRIQTHLDQDHEYTKNEPSLNVVQCVLIEVAEQHAFAQTITDSMAADFDHSPSTTKAEGAASHTHERHSVPQAEREEHEQQLIVQTCSLDRQTARLWKHLVKAADLQHGLVSWREWRFVAHIAEAADSVLGAEQRRRLLRRAGAARLRRSER